MAECSRISPISLFVTPLRMAPSRWSSSSSALPSATSIAIFSMLRIRRGSPGRDHTIPQADLVASICIGMVNASAVLSCFSTYAAPSTRLRNFSPCSNSLSLISTLPKVRPPERPPHGSNFLSLHCLIECDGHDNRKNRSVQCLTSGVMRNAGTFSFTSVGRYNEERMSTMILRGLARGEETTTGPHP